MFFCLGASENSDNKNCHLQLAFGQSFDLLINSAVSGKSCSTRANNEHKPETERHNSFFQALVALSDSRKKALVGGRKKAVSYW